MMQQMRDLSLLVTQPHARQLHALVSKETLQETTITVFSEALKLS